jgi:putative Flp pilus-assembly TadE/G-like protein
MTSASAPSRSLRDEAGLIGKVAVIWIVVLLLVGLLLLDGLSIVLSTFKLSNTAQAAASTAATTYKNLHDETRACAAAEPNLLSDNVPVPENGGWCKIDTATGEATITLRAQASSIVLGRLSFTEDLTKITVKESAQPSSL